MKEIQHYINEASKLSDLQGTPIDEGIITLVAALHMHGFKTSGSCEGHNNEYGLFYPFVTLNYPEPEGYYDFDHEEENEELDALREHWLKQNLSQQERLIELLQEFYHGKEITNLNTVLILNTFGPGICELRSYGAELMMLNGTHTQDLPLYQAEIQAFKDFLIERDPS